MTTPTAKPTTLYRLYDAAGVLLYVGITDDRGHRFEEHARLQPWWPEVTKACLEWFGSLQDAQIAERDAISSECPKYNVLHSMENLSMTTGVLLVLSALTEQPDRQRYGLDLGRQVGLASGTIYPLLARLERRGWVESGWEKLDRHRAGRPPRRYYRLTPAGEQAARAQLGRLAKLRKGRPYA